MRESEARRLLSDPPDGDLTAAVREVLRCTRRTGWMSIGQVAALAGMSVRTFQRRLAEEEAIFCELVDQVRAELAMELLKDTQASLSEIGRQAGYSTASNFTRAFQQWTGKTPAEFRREL